MGLFKNYKKMYENKVKEMTVLSEFYKSEKKNNGILSDELDIANLKIKKLERENKLLKNQIDNLKFECVKSEGKKKTKKVTKEKDTTTKKRVGRPRKVDK